MFSFVVFWIWIKQILSGTNGLTFGLCNSRCVTISKMIQKRRSFWRQWRYGMHLQVHVWLFICLVILIIYLVVPISLLPSIASTQLPLYLHTSFCACVSLILWRPWVKCCFFDTTPNLFFQFPVFVWCRVTRWQDSSFVCLLFRSRCIN